jgi:enoyl-CoA hydratase/carnithine racemase
VSAAEELVLVEWFGGGRVAVARLNRPEAHNAMNTRLAEVLIDTFEHFASRSALRCAILTGSGSRAFCAGADLRERSDMAAAAWHAQHRIFERAFAGLRRFEKPLIAAVNGVAAGGGLELALNADFILASTNARFGQPEVRVGIIPGGGAAQLLPACLPSGLARQMLMTGELIDAQRALAAGLANSVHAPDELLPAALDVAERISANSPAAVRSVKAAVADGVGRPLEEAIALGLETYNRLVDGPDRYEGVRAFNERRAPEFAD